MAPVQAPPGPTLRHRLYTVIFEADTPAGKAFDLALLALILLSIVAVMLESVAAYRQRFGPQLQAVEWAFTALFTVEYALRLFSVRRPASYARSFFGVVDLLSILSTYLSLFIPGAQSLLIIRSLRLVRVFRVLKLARYVGEGELLASALRQSRQKITVFLVSVVTVVVVVGALMYLVEGADAGFTSIPQSVYWAIVTMTTVGYGDIAPQTVAGKVIASALMILGYAVLAVPTGIVTAEVVEAHNRRREPTVTARACPGCIAEGHRVDAAHCWRCGSPLNR